jgi:hypothetical protein
MSDFTDFFPVAGGVGGAGDGTGAAINEQIPLVQTSLTPGFDTTTEIYTHPNGQEYLKSGKTIQLSQATYPSASPSVVGLGGSTTYQAGFSANYDWVTHDGTNGWGIRGSRLLDKYSADWSTLISTTDLRTPGGYNTTGYNSVASDGTNLYILYDNGSATRRILKFTASTMTLTRDAQSNGYGGIPTGLFYDWNKNILLCTDSNRDLVLQFRISDLANLGTYSTGNIVVGYKGFTYNLEYDSYVFKSNVGAFKLYDATSWALVATISPNTVNGVFYTNPTENKLWDRVGSGPPNGYLQLFETLGTYGIPTGVDPVTSQPYFWRIK